MGVEIVKIDKGTNRMDKRYQVFISSTYSDLKEERSKVMQTIMSLNCIPAGMELFPASNDEQFEFIKRVIDDCDYYILIVGGRYGSLSEEGISYTEKEFEYAKSKGLPILAFLHNDLDSIPLGKSEKDPIRREMLSNFRDKVSTGRLIQFWKTAEELAGKVATSLSITIMQYPAVGWVRANLLSTVESLQRENELRKSLAEAKDYISKLENERNDVNSIKNIASLDEKMKIRFTHIWWSTSIHQDVSKAYLKELSWGELFESIAPRLMDNPNEERARKIVGDVLGEKEYLNGGKIQVNKEDFDTIKIQFIALGLINVSYQKTVQGGMALFWQLTSKGKSIMISRRTVLHKSV